MPRTIHDILPDGTFNYWMYDSTPWKTLRNMLPSLKFTPPELPFGRQHDTYHILETVDRTFYHALVDGRRHRRSEAVFNSVFSQNLRSRNRNLVNESFHFGEVPPAYRNKRPRDSDQAFAWCCNPRGRRYDITTSEDDTEIIDYDSDETDI